MVTPCLPKSQINKSKIKQIQQNVKLNDLKKKDLQPSTKALDQTQHSGLSQSESGAKMNLNASPLKLSAL